MGGQSELKVFLLGILGTAEIGMPVQGSEKQMSKKWTCPHYPHTLTSVNTSAKNIFITSHLYKLDNRKKGGRNENQFF